MSRVPASPLCEETSRCKAAAAGSDYTLYYSPPSVLRPFPSFPAMPTWISSPAQRGAAPALQGLYNNRGGHALARREGGRDNLPSTATAIAIDFFGACLSLDRRRKFNANVIFIFFISCPMWQNYCPPLRLNYTGADAGPGRCNQHRRQISSWRR